MFSTNFQWIRVNQGYPTFLAGLFNEKKSSQKRGSPLRLTSPGPFGRLTVPAPVPHCLPANESSREPERVKMRRMSQKGSPKGPQIAPDISQARGCATLLGRS